MMKILQFTVLSLALSFGLSTQSYAQSSSSAISNPEYSGVAGGGAGGLPAPTIGFTSFGTTTVDPSARSTSQPSFRRAGMSTTSKAAQVLLTRRQMLDCIDTALNASDLSIKVDNQPATVRILSIDLKSATLRGRILETNKPVLLIEKAKQSSDRPAAE